LFPTSAAPPGRTHGWGIPEVRLLPAPRRLDDESAYDGTRHVGICDLHTYTAHSQIADSGGTAPSDNARKEETVYAPIARISKAIARNGIDISRQPRWINDADAEQIARVNEAVAALRIR
jgi:hypothetical protein